MEPSREEVLAELYLLNKKLEKIKQIISKPVYCCGGETFGKKCCGIYITDESYKELKDLLGD